MLICNKYNFTNYILLIFVVLFFACRKTEFNEQLPSQKLTEPQQRKPNIILILGDDIGYEIPTCNGGESYSTTTIDNLAKKGMRFTQCQACPNCSPTRIELLAGKYGFRNYTQWGA